MSTTSQSPTMMTSPIEQFSIDISNECIIKAASSKRRTTFTHGSAAHSLNKKSLTKSQAVSEKLVPILIDYLPQISSNDLPGSNAIYIDSELSKKLKMQPYMIERLAQALKIPMRNNNQIVLAAGDIEKLARLSEAPLHVRAWVLFIMIAGGDNECINKEQFQQFFEQYFIRMNVFDKDRQHEIIQLLCERFRLNTTKMINFNEFYDIILQDPTLLESLPKGTVGLRSSIPSPKAQEKPCIQRYCNKLCTLRTYRERFKRVFNKNYLHNHRQPIVFLMLYVLVNMTLTIYVGIYRGYKEKARAILVVARIAGMLLNFNSAVIILLMLKGTVSIIRSKRTLRKFIPVDHHIDFHKIVGYYIGILAFVHTIAHIVNFALLAKSNVKPHISWLEYMFTTRSGIGWIGGFASLSGMIIFIVLLIMITCSSPCIRRSGYFQIFHWTHLLYWVYFTFLIVHAPNCWKFVIGPCAIFTVEKVYFLITSCSSRSGRTHLQSATIEKSGVISLKIHRPKHFTFRPGDYIMINVPSIAAYEFHPFTISSSPEDNDYITVHIQAVGGWTRHVHRYFREMSVQDQMRKHIRVHRADSNPTRAVFQQIQGDENHFINNNRTMNRSSFTSSEYEENIIIRGPYSSSARYVFDCKHAVLIGGGIGITPYASILSSLTTYLRNSRITCQQCGFVNYNRCLVEHRRLQKVDFVWVNRDYKSFEWFLNLLHQFEEEQESYLASNPQGKRFLDIHLFFTRIQPDNTIGNAPLNLAIRTWSDVTNEDIFTNLRTKTVMQRPNWKTLFNGFISGENESCASDVNVFFCGSPALGKNIQEHCNALGLRFFKEDC